MKPTYTIIKIDDNKHVHNCDVCGAFSLKSSEEVKHHLSCNPEENARIIKHDNEYVEGQENYEY